MTRYSHKCATCWTILLPTLKRKCRSRGDFTMMKNDERRSIRARRTVILFLFLLPTYCDLARSRACFSATAAPNNLYTVNNNLFISQCTPWITSREIKKKNNREMKFSNYFCVEYRVEIMESRSMPCINWRNDFVRRFCVMHLASEEISIPRVQLYGTTSLRYLLRYKLARGTESESRNFIRPGTGSCARDLYVSRLFYCRCGDGLFHFRGDVNVWPAAVAHGTHSSTDMRKRVRSVPECGDTATFAEIKRRHY